MQKVSKRGKGERRTEIGDQRNKAVEYAIFKTRKTSAEVRVGTMLGLTWRAGIESVTVTTEAIPSGPRHNCHGQNLTKAP